MKIFKENFRVFEFFLKFIEVSWNLRENLRNMSLYVVLGAEAPEAGENIKILVEKTWIFSEFWLAKANFNKNLGKFDGILKISNNSKWG